MTQYVYYLDVDTSLRFRDGVRDSEYIIDMELTELGFDGTENEDWINLQAVS